MPNTGPDGVQPCGDVISLAPGFCSVPKTNSNSSNRIKAASMSAVRWTIAEKNKGKKADNEQKEGEGQDIVCSMLSCFG